MVINLIIVLSLTAVTLVTKVSYVVNIAVIAMVTSLSRTCLSLYQYFLNYKVSHL
jgi:hypothetical protein